MSTDYVHYGCGLVAPPGWKNFDASPTLRFERIPILGKLYTKNEARFPDNVLYGDIVRGLPVADGSCRGVYCSHVLEHLALDDLRRALRNTYRMLGPGGVFRLVVPDLEHMARVYVEDSSQTAGEQFMKSLHLGRPRRSRGVRGLVEELVGNSYHRWMWDFRSLSQELESAGFAGVRRATIGDAADAKFQEVEDPGRWENCLGIEGAKQ